MLTTIVVVVVADCHHHCHHQYVIFTVIVMPILITVVMAISTVIGIVVVGLQALSLTRLAAEAKSSPLRTRKACRKRVWTSTLQKLRREKLRNRAQKNRLNEDADPGKVIKFQAAWGSLA